MEMEKHHKKKHWKITKLSYIDFCIVRECVCPRERESERKRERERFYSKRQKMTRGQFHKHQMRVFKMPNNGVLIPKMVFNFQEVSYTFCI